MAMRGRWFLGDEIPLGVLTTDGAGTPTLPDACPALEIYSSAGKVLGGWVPGGMNGNGSLVPIQDRYGTTGLFGTRLFLGPAFAPGLYQATYRWKISTFLGLEVDTFEVLAGGSVKGSPLAMYFHRQPQADFLVRQLDSGRLVSNRNPRV